MKSEDAAKAQNGDHANEFAVLPVYDVEVSAGDGSICYGEQPLYYFAYRKDWLKTRGLFEKNLHVVVAKGDSMEPTISDGESILVNTADKHCKDGFIYVIRSGDILWVKRIQKQLDSSLLLISDNKIYPPMRLNLDESNDVEIIGKVVNSSKNFY
jgi:phage repressor protein C with HTH and peptisase S24 domain